MNIFEAFRIAFNHVLSRKMRSWLTLIGIFAGIAAVVALISLGQGMTDAINDQFAGLGVNTVTIQGAGVSYGPPGTTAYGKLTKNDVNLIKKINGIDYVIPRYIEQAIFKKRDIDIYGYVVSMPDKSDEEKVLINNLNIELEEGSFFDISSENKILLGDNIANGEDYTFRVGEKLELNGREFKVSGIIKKKGNFMVDGAALLPKKALEELFNKGEEDYDIIVAIAHEGEDINLIKESIERTMRKDRNQKMGEEDFKISTAQETLDTLNSILLTVQVLLVGIAAISLLVGGIGIANTMYTAVLERRREIGIMKAIGAKNSEVLSLFLIESGLLGLAGGVLGLFFGIVISKGVEFGAAQYFGESILKASVPIPLVIGALLFAFLVGALSGTLPAKSASKMKIVDTFRN